MVLLLILHYKYLILVFDTFHLLLLKYHLLLLLLKHLWNNYLIPFLIVFALKLYLLLLVFLKYQFELVQLYLLFLFGFMHFAPVLIFHYHLLALQYLLLQGLEGQLCIGNYWWLASKKVSSNTTFLFWLTICNLVKENFLQYI